MYVFSTYRDNQGKETLPSGSVEERSHANTIRYRCSLFAYGIEGLLGKIAPAVVLYLKGLRNLRTLHMKANIFPVDSETEVKKVNKMRLAEYIEAMSGVKVSLDAMFDVQTKRIREYKKGSCLIYLALSIDMTVSRKNYLIPSKGSHHHPPALCTPSSSSCHGDLRSWTRTELAIVVTASSSGFGIGKRPNPPRRPPSSLAPALLLPSDLLAA
ncbi:unnamed protein product [Prunus armeniaca]